VPQSVKLLNVVLIDDWNVNCCGGTHCKTTGEVPPIKILRTNFRANKNEVQFVFTFQDSSKKNQESTTSSTSSNKEEEKETTENQTSNKKKSGKSISNKTDEEKKN